MNMKLSTSELGGDIPVAKNWLIAACALMAQNNEIIFRRRRSTT